MVWLIPLNIALSSNDAKEGKYPFNLKAVYFTAVIIVALKPTAILLGNLVLAAVEKCLDRCFPSDDDDDDGFFSK